MASRIFLSFANIKDDLLPTLREEDDRLYELFSEREQQGHFRLHRDSYITTQKIGDYLLKYKNEVILFHYSGHANQDWLILEDKPAFANGIAEYLSECPHLKLVVLNGCSTQGQVERLLELDSSPVIIATNAPVDDQSATLFSITFYKYFCEQEKTIQESFEAAIKQVRLSGKEVTVVRSLSTRASQDKAVWGLFSKSESRLYWKLPTARENPDPDFIPNSILIPTLLEAFAPYTSLAKKEQAKGDKAKKKDKVKAVLEPLALPISEQLRKLIAPEQTDSQHNFFDKVSLNRLKQIKVSYSTIIELITFILLAELWNHGLKKKPIDFSKKDIQELKHFFCLSYSERKKYNFPVLIEKLRDILSQNSAPLFVNELNDLPAFDQISTEFGKAIAYLEDLKKSNIKGLNQNDIYHECIKGEKMLAILYRDLAFMTLYSLRSVKTIDVHHYRHSEKPKFNHKVVKLIQTFVNALQEDIDERVEYMYTFSVCLLKKRRKTYLNISPFVIDQNAFDSSKELAKIYYFEVYEKGMDNLVFKHVYKPDDSLFEANSKDHKVIMEQFDAFTLLLFNKPIQDLCYEKSF